MPYFVSYLLVFVGGQKTFSGSCVARLPPSRFHDTLVLVTKRALRFENRNKTKQGDRLVASPPAYTADLSALPAALDGAKRLTEVLQVTVCKKIGLALTHVSV